MVAELTKKNNHNFTKRKAIRLCELRLLGLSMMLNMQATIPSIGYPKKKIVFL